MPRKGVPDQTVGKDSAAHCAALVGADFFGLRPAVEVGVGDAVASGQIVLRDRRHPEIAFAAPLSGRVSAIEFGPRRTLSNLIIQCDPDIAVAGEDTAPLMAATDADLRALLLARGLWAGFRTRPFGFIPGPQDRPSAIVVNTVPTSVLAPAPRVVIAARKEEFRKGLSSLPLLIEGPVFLCRDAGDDYLTPPVEHIIEVVFAGTSAAGLAGTQINRLCRAGATRQVWSVGYQDVISIGHLLRTGQYLAERIISIGGPRAAQPRLVRSVLGADLHELAAHETKTDGASACTVLSGDPLTGCKAHFLRRYHDQVTLTDPIHPAERSGRLHSLLVQRSAITPMSSLERAMALDIFPVPLMRALSVGDVEAAERLGCLELIEEDVAALSRLCTSGADYGDLLRDVLDQLAVDAG